jgi:hypothetical protein
MHPRGERRCSILFFFHFQASMLGERFDEAPGEEEEKKATRSSCRVLLVVTDRSGKSSRGRLTATKNGCRRNLVGHVIDRKCGPKSRNSESDRNDLIRCCSLSKMRKVMSCPAQTFDVKQANRSARRLPLRDRCR